MPADYEKAPSKSVRFWLSNHHRSFPVHFRALVAVSILLSLLLLWYAFYSQPNIKAHVIIATYHLRTLDRERTIRSALAVIKSRYVWGRIPLGEIPRLMVAYTCTDGTNCGATLSDRFCGVVTTFFITLMFPQAAFLADWTHPARLEWYFQNEPLGITISLDQGHTIMEQTNQSSIIVLDTLIKDINPQLASTDIIKQWSHARIISLQTAQVAWPALVKNPYLRNYTGSYNLHRLKKSEFFYVVYQLLFARPTDWFWGILEEYRELIGPPYVNYQVPTFVPLPPGIDNPNYHAPHDHMLRIGVEFVSSEDDNDNKYASRANCVALTIARACKPFLKSDRLCSVFITSSDSRAIESLTASIARQSSYIKVITTTHKYPSFHFTDSLTDPNTINAIKHWTGQISNPEDTQWSDDELRLAFAKHWLDWTILTRMDYLIVSDNTGTNGHKPSWGTLAETAAWVAGVRFERIKQDCTAEKYEDW